MPRSLWPSGVPVDVISLRPGRSYRAATLLGQIEERRIVIILAGDIAADWAEPWTGYRAATDAETFAQEAAAALERLSPRGRELLVAAEEDVDGVGDEASARYRSEGLNDYDPMTTALQAVRIPPPSVSSSRQRSGYRMPWHIEDARPTRARELGLLLMVCGTSVVGEDRGIDYLEDPGLEDRCPACQGRLDQGEEG